MADDDKDKGDDAGAAGKGKSKLIIIIAAVVVLLLAGGGGAMMFMGGNEEPSAAVEGEEGTAEEAAAEAEDTSDSSGPVDGKAIYHEFHPVFVINIYDKGNRASFLQVGIAFVTRNERVSTAARKHDALIKNHLLNLMSDRTYEELRTPEGKEALRGEIKAEIAKVLKEQREPNDVEKVLFTNFVMQ